MSEEYIYDNLYSQINSIDFDVLSNNEIKRMSALGEGIGIEIADLYDNAEPKKGGLIDPRLGTSGIDINCATCGLNTTYCVGHFGHIDLAEVVFHIGYLPFVHKILTCICPRCSKLLIYKNEEEIKDILKMRTGKERMSYIRAASKNITYCQNPNYGCGAQIPKIKVEINKSSGAINIIAEIELNSKENKENNEGNKKLRQILTPDIVYDILKNISDSDCIILGMDPLKSRPEDMIHKVFPVPPVQMRPSVRGDFAGGTSMEDDLTHLLANIVKANIRIIKNKENQNENNSKYNIDHAHLLQYHVGYFIEDDSIIPLNAEQKGKQYKTLASRLKGKTGRVRGNLMGKRGDFTARTVITSDPTIGNNQLGVPIKIAMNLTFPEVVTPYNIDYLNKLIKNGRDDYPGANFVFPVSNMVPGKRLLPIDLRYKKEATELHYGDIVERHLKDGDIVLLNRQPTLHKQSMMGHRIKIINNPDLMTYRLSVAITTPYNADFDGDEMNIFVPQSLQTQIELEEIACVEKQIITPTTSKTIVGIVQDGLIGAYNLTSPTVRIDWRTAMNIMSYTSLEDFTTIKKNKDYTGSELFSLIIPSEINIHKSTIKIKNGQLIDGRLTKDVLGAKKKNNLIQLIWDGYGVIDTKNFIDNTQRLMNNFNLWHGFSVGIGDIDISKEIYNQIEKIFQIKELKVEHIITEMENNPDYMQQDLFEQKLFSELNIVRDDVSKLIMSDMKQTNACNIMSLSGSKGDITNIGQMSGCAGLQALEGKIVSKKYNNRTLAYYHQNDDRASSRGLVRQSFITGLEFPEFVFHHMAGRMGIIDQAIKSVTGDTPIIIQENGEIKRVLIGDWIDSYLEKNINKIKHQPEKDMELLKLDNNKVYIPTIDDFGNISWENIKAVTRHDPGNELYEIKTYGGRKVIVVQSKSLLVWNDKTEKFEEKLTKDIKIGEYVPVTMNLLAPPNIINYIYNTNFAFNILEKFELNKENGIFIGLFLAENNINILNGNIQITNNNDNVISFVKKWFDKLLIPYINIVNGVSGTSHMIAKFLINIVGYDINKYILNEAFNAPDEFIIGLIDGYISGNSNITENSIQINCISNRLVEGLNILCNRLGIFGKLTYNTFTIMGKWLNIFINKIKLTDNNKQQQLNQIIYTEKYIEFISQNDVVLDKIESITKVDSNKYPKVYDLTVPKTLNFGLANGLHVRDTAETGYTQRKLIKLMEDIMIKYDGTVRSVNERLIQLIYGESGADTTKQYEYVLKLVEMNNEEIKIKFNFTPQELKKIKGFTEKDNNKLYNTVLELRDIIRESVRKARLNYIILVTNFMLPVNLNRIIDTISANSNLNSKEDITPNYILDQIEKVLRNDKTTLLYMSEEERSNKQSFKNRDEILHKTVFKASLYDSLNPRRVIIDLGLNKSQFDKIIEEIISNFNKNMVEPGEMAGIIAAQSTGEPLTQMSTSKDTNIIIRNKITKEIYYGEIGFFIDDLLNKNKSKILYLPNHKDSVILNIYNYEILSVCPSDNKTYWKEISQISRHPSNGDLMKVITKTGRTVTTTKSHSHLKKTINGIIPIEGFKLKIGDKIPIAKNIPEMIDPLTQIKIGNAYIQLDYMFGLICGAYLADGNIYQNKISTNNKCLCDFLKNNFENKIPEFVFGSNKIFISGILSSYFDRDGHIKCNNKNYCCIGHNQCNNKNYCNICINSKSKKLIEGLSILFAYFGIYGSLLEEKNINQYSLSIHKKYAKIFNDKIGLSNINKKKTLLKIIDLNNILEKESSNIIWDKIISIETINDPKEYVYDFTIPTMETFMVNTGVFIHNTLNSFHHSGIASMSATVQGVPRMKELLSVSKKPKTPQMVIYLTDEFMGSKGMAHKIASHIKHTTLSNIRGRINVYYDPTPKATDSIMEKDNVKHIFYQHKGTRTICQSDIAGLPWLMRIELDREKMLEKEITLLEIKSKFCNWWETRFGDYKSMKKEEKKVLTKITQLAVLSNSDNDKQPILHIRFNVKDIDKDKDRFDMNTIDNFIDFIIDKFKLKGINLVTDIPAIQEERILIFNKDTGTIDRNTQYVIYTAGVNLNDIRYLTGIDLNKTISNHVIDMYNIYGIEIARAILLREIANAYERAGGEVNYQHITMIVDQMTATGTINSIDRHGMNKIDNDPLSRASFEKTIEQLLIASVYGETDYMKSVSSRIMAGTVIKGGTCYCELELDTEMIEKSEYIENIDYTKKFTELNKGNLAEDIIKKKNDDIFIPM